MFNSDLKKQLTKARGELETRLQALRDLLSHPDLDDKLRIEVERKADRLKLHLQTGIHKLNGGG